MESVSGEFNNSLKRRIGLLAATLAGVGIILGAGIYVLVGVAAGEAGNAVWISFLIAALAASFTAVSYARLSRLHPKNAPEYQFLSLAFGQTPGFLAGWLILWAATISAATVALGFGGYLQHLSGLPYLGNAVGLIVLSSLIVFIGVGESALVAGILTVIEVTGVVLIIIIGLPHLGKINLLESPGGLQGIISGASLVVFAYLGFEGMANLAEEMKNPERDLPKAMLFAVGLSTLLYVLVTISAVSTLGWQALSQSNAPLAAVAARFLGAGADLVLTLIALGSTANTVLLLLFAASRAMWAMSCAGALPMNFCVIGENRQTPWLTIIIVGSLASLFALINNIGEIADFTNFATLITFAGVNASAIKIFWDNKSTGKFKGLLFDILIPVLGIASALWLAVNTGWKAALFGVALIISGLIFNRVFNR